MHQFVSQDVIGLSKTSGEREHDPSFVEFGDAAGAFTEKTRYDVGLDELRMACVEHDRLALGELEVERLREPRVPPFGESARFDRRVVLRRVVVDVEVRRLENSEVEIVVVNFVAAERLRTGRSRRRHQHDEREPGNSDQH